MTEQPLRTDRLVAVTLDETGLAPATPEVEQERQVAIFDLLEENRFALPPRDGREAPGGPYRLHLSIRERRLVFDVAREDGEAVAAFHLSLTPFQQVVKDYFQICSAYFDAVKRLPPAQIEAIDMGRRGIHNEGSRVLLERLDGKVETDMATARRLFTLICVLHYKD
jgi:uncharacterized protein (UPF0262 family)